jgi:general nucleoside transport system permease protein
MSIQMLERAAVALASIAVALGVAVLLLVVVDAPPLEALRLLWDGSFGTVAKLSDTLMTWIPLVLAAAGLIVTFQAGLWNIGAEGQIVAGAIGATWVARSLGGPSALVITATIAGGAAAGAVYALVPGYLRSRFEVHEIFSGVAFNFLAGAVAVYLIIGPWGRAGIASTSGTDIINERAWLPTLGAQRISLVALFAAVVAVVAVAVLMGGTRYGLRVKAVGRSPASARLMGVSPQRYTLSAFFIGGALAGVAGSVQVTGFHHKLVPSISGGYGFLAILVVLLAGFRVVWIAPIALFFAAIQVGSTQLSLRLSIDSSLAGVIQGVLVLTILLLGGWRSRRALSIAAARPVVE